MLGDKTNNSTAFSFGFAAAEKERRSPHLSPFSAVRLELIFLVERHSKNKNYYYINNISGGLNAMAVYAPCGERCGCWIKRIVRWFGDTNRAVVSLSPIFLKARVWMNIAIGGWNVLHPNKLCCLCYRHHRVRCALVYIIQRKALCSFNWLRQPHFDFLLPTCAAIGRYALNSQLLCDKWRWWEFEWCSSDWSLLNFVRSKITRGKKAFFRVFHQSLFPLLIRADLEQVKLIESLEYTSKKEVGAWKR